MPAPATLSPWNRVSVYLSLCAVSNHIRASSGRNTSPTATSPPSCLPDDCLRKPYPVDLPWKNGMPGSALQTSSDPSPTEEGGTDMNLFTKLQQRAAEGRPVRIGLIGAGKFGSMYLAQMPRTPGVHLVGIADLSPEAALTQPGARGLGCRSACRPPAWTRRCATATPMSAKTGRRWCATRRST
jgi:hypothetical protein